MNATDTSWLENRISAAVADDFYLDRGEEKAIKEESSSKGFPIADIEVVLRTVLETYGAVSERQLVDTLDKWLHQSTDHDKKLDKKEERDALDRVVRIGNGKKAALDPRVAEEYVSNFCKVNGIVRSSDGNKLLMPAMGLLAVLLLIGGYALFTKKPVEAQSLAPVVAIASAETKLTDADRAEIDDQLRRAVQYVTASQLTDPPEKSAKACLDAIRRIDPAEQYKGKETRDLVAAIVDQYIAMAEKSAAQKDKSATQRWLDRAKLFHAGSELIREKERTFGLIEVEKR